MPSAPVRQSQITRAIKAVKAAGVPIGRVEVAPDGTVNVYSGVEKIDGDECTNSIIKNKTDEWL